MTTCSPVQPHLFHLKSPIYRSMDIKTESEWGYHLAYNAPPSADYSSLAYAASYGVTATTGLTLGLENTVPGTPFDQTVYPSGYIDYGYSAATNPIRSDPASLFQSPYGLHHSTGHYKQQLHDSFMPQRRLEHELNLFKMEKRPCDVCGDVAAGFHCGAYVCEACKKFFIRSSRAELQGSSKYSCTKSGNCEISKETRTHCQYCRFQKCISLNMFPPGKNPTMGAPISEIPCRVCGAPSSGFHFGAITCEGCKGFFRRTIKERDSGKYICSKGSHCDINQQTRNACKSCRFTKCLQAGMSSEGSRIGRQPNAVKHMCAQEIHDLKSKRRRVDPYTSTNNSTVMEPSNNFVTNDQSQGTNYSSASAMYNNNNSSIEDQQSQQNSSDIQTLANSSSSRLSACSDSDNQLSPLNKSTLYYEHNDSSIDEIRQFSDAVLAAFSELNALKQRPTMPMSEKISPCDIWTNYLMKHFYWLAQVVIKFACRIPGFVALDEDVRQQLLIESFYPIVLLHLAMEYDLVNSDSSGNNLLRMESLELTQIHQYFPNLYQTITDHAHCLGGQLAPVDFDRTEYSLMICLRLLRFDLLNINTLNQTRISANKRLVNEMYSRTQLALRYYQNDKYMGDHTTYDWIQRFQIPLDSLTQELDGRLRQLGISLDSFFLRLISSTSIL